MKLSAEDYRHFGKTGLRLPPIVFGIVTLVNAIKPIPQKNKTAICCEWFKHVPPPVVIDAVANDKTGQAFHTIAAVLRHLEIAPQELVVINRLSCQRTSSAFALNQDVILEGLDEAGELLGGAAYPQLVAIDDIDEYLYAGTSFADQDRGLENILDAYRALGELKSQGRVVGIGAAARDWRILQVIDARVPLDWIMLKGSLTILRHPPELLEFMNELSLRQVAIISSAVFHGGFLIGGSCFDNRTLNVQNDEDKALYSWRKSFVALCQGHGIVPAQACIQFVLNAPGVVAVVLNTSHPDRIQENVEHAVTKVPNAFWASMKEEGLLVTYYPRVV